MRKRAIAMLASGILMLSLGAGVSMAQEDGNPSDLGGEEMQSAIAALQIDARKDFPDTFAGLWVEDQKMVHVAFTQQPEESVKSVSGGFPQPEALQPELRPNSEATLEALKGELVEDREQVRDGALEIGDTTDANYDLALDPKSSEIDALFKDAPKDSQAAFSARYGDDVKVTSGAVSEPTDCTRADCRYTLRGGLRAESDVFDGNQISVCTTGFAIHGPSGADQILSAAHCPRSIRRNGDERYGEVKDEQQAARVDAERHSINFNGFDSRAWIYLEPGATSREIHDKKTWDEMYVGQPVCKTGQTSGKTCGDVLSVDVSPSYVQNSSKFIGSEACVQSGDSGSPFYWANTALGITSGTATVSCSNSAYFSIFGQIQFALGALDATLRTLPG